MAQVTGLDDAALFRQQRKVAIMLIAAMGMLLVASTLWKRYFLSTNPASRIITVERLVEAGTFAHWTPTDSTPFPRSIDVIGVGGNIYSSKPPNYPLLMTAEALAMKAVTGWEFYPHHRDYVRVLLWINQVLPYLGMLYAAFLFLRGFTRDSFTLYFMLLSLGVGSLPYAYAATINNHTLATLLFVLGFFWTLRLAEGKGRRWQAVALGFVLGFAVSTELPGAAFAAAMLFLLARSDWRLAALALGGMVLPFVPMFIVFKVISGSWKPFYFQGNLYRYPGSYWTQPQGLDALNEGKARYLLNILVGYRGLFVTTPVLALGVWGAATRLLRKGEPMRWAWWAVTAASVAVFLFVWLRTKNYGGDCIGLRWMIVTMPFLLLMAWPVVERLGRRTWGRVLCVALLLPSLPHTFEALWHDAFILGSWQEWWGAFFR